MKEYERQEKIASKLSKKKGVIILHKSTRAGASISLVLEALRSGKKVVLVCPTRRIIKEVERRVRQLLGSSPKIASIYSNTQLCRQLDPNLRIPFQFLGDCFDCPYDNANDCNLQRIVDGDSDLYLLTYQKLRALTVSGSWVAERVMSKLHSCDIAILDEFTTALLAEVKTLTLVEWTEDFRLISSASDKCAVVYEKLQELENESNLFDFDLVEKAIISFLAVDFFPKIKDFAREKKGENGIFNNEFATQYDSEQRRLVFRETWRCLTELAKRGVDVTTAANILLIAQYPRIVVTTEFFSTIPLPLLIKISPLVSDALRYIRTFSQRFSRNKLIFVVDSYQPNILFENIFEGEVVHELFGKNGDPLNTDKQQLIVTDTSHWGSPNFGRDKRLQAYFQIFINDLLKVFSPTDIVIVTTNIKTAKLISHMGLPKEIRLTWHRSDWMRGVSVENRRIMVIVGGPYLPKSSYIAESESFDPKYFSNDVLGASKEYIARTLKNDNIRSEFVNAIGRIKDPLAEERGIIFTLGMTLRDVKVMLKQTGPLKVSRPHVVRPYAKGGLLRDGSMIADIWMNRTDIAVKDLPVIARLLRYVKKKKIVTASKVLPSATNLVKEKALKYRAVLRQCNVKVVEKRGGIEFQWFD